jgi:hypothetical protein
MDSATLSKTLILIGLFVGIAFLSLTVDGENSSTALRAAGILEWIMASGERAISGYLCGFLRGIPRLLFPSFLY